MSSEVTIRQGNLKSSISVSGAYRRFLKVPYASVTGKFQAPGDPPSWKGTLNVARGSSRCKQYFSRTRTPIGFKDCPVLNVYTPTIALKTPFPVMVFIHGGGYFWGSNTHLLCNPKHLLNKQVIGVTVNYRLGAFGLFCLLNKGAPGNAGLKDQVAALKWISKYIEYFGGDANSVTLSESVGAVSIDYLLVSPSTQGLFHRVILQSGSMLMTQAFDNDPIANASLVAARLGYISSDPDELLNIFNLVSEENVTIETYRDQTNNAFAPYVFRPCIEEPSADAIITAHPRDILKSPNLNSDVTAIIGYNDKEGMKWASKYNSDGIQNLIQNFSQTIIPHNLYFRSKNGKYIFIADVKRIYFENKTSENDILDGLINYFSDACIMYPVLLPLNIF